MKLTKIVFTFFLLSTFCLMSTASAANYIFEANLDGLQEVSPNASPAFGLAELTLDDVTGNWSITTGSYQDLLGSSNVIAIHNAPVGANGPILAPLTNNTPGAMTGTFSGSGTFTLAQIADLNAGLYYVNVHSAVFPGGEIRGQLVAVPEPSSVILAGLGCIGVGILHRWKKSSKN